MSDNDKARVGMKFPIKLEDLVTPWVGSTVFVQFEDGQKVEARILEVTPGVAEMLVTGTDSKLPK